MVGGRGEDSFNRSVQALRSPGSAIKIFAYTAAIDKGITVADVYIDEPTEFTTITGEVWSPRNYYETFAGEVTVREALEDSLNVIAAQIVDELGPQTVIDYAKKMGITTFVEQGRVNDVGLAPLALGGMTKGVSLLELATAYGVLANQGIKTEPFSILKVTDANGNILEQNSPRMEVVLMRANQLCDDGSPARCHRARHWKERQHWPPGRRKDGYPLRLPGCVVCGVHP